MATLIKNAVPDLIDAIKAQNGFIGYAKNRYGNITDIATIMPDRILAIYKNYVAVDNADHMLNFYTVIQNDILQFKVFHIENPGNAFGLLNENYTYNFMYYEYNNPNFNMIVTESPVNGLAYPTIDLFELSILVNKVLANHPILKVSSMELFDKEDLNKYQNNKDFQKQLNSGNQILITHQNSLSDVYGEEEKTNKLIIAEYDKEHSKNNNKKENNDKEFDPFEYLNM